MLCATVDRMLSITNDLKMLAYENTGLKEETLAHKVSHLIEEKKLELGSEAKLCFRPDPSTYVKANNPENLSILLRIISNIINNAFDAKREEMDSLIDVQLKITETNILLRISDNGIGLGALTASELYKQGYSTKAQGSGLGLYEAYEVVVEQWQGKLEVSDNHNFGTVVNMAFPVKYLVDM